MPVAMFTDLPATPGRGWTLGPPSLVNRPSREGGRGAVVVPSSLSGPPRHPDAGLRFSRASGIAHSHIQSSVDFSLSGRHTPGHGTR
jgi:hypothetical protein